MAKTYEELLEQAAIIRDETAAGKNTATRVGGTITDAVDYVKELQDTYAGIHAEAAEAKTEAAAAKLTAAEAKTAAGNALTNAKGAVLTANAASGTATEAKANADAAKATAEGIAATAQAAKDIADAANIAAQDAKATADGVAKTAQDAKDVADAAKTTADQAKQSATNAFNNARNAILTANSASGTATEAKKTADDAKAGLEEAVRNLNDEDIRLNGIITANTTEIADVKSTAGTAYNYALAAQSAAETANTAATTEKERNDKQDERLEKIENSVSNLSAAGRYWNEANGTPTAAGHYGSLDALRSLPEKLGLGRYLVKDDRTRRKLDPKDSKKYADDGTDAKLDGTDGQCMWCWNGFYANVWKEGDNLFKVVSFDRPVGNDISIWIPAGGISWLGAGVMDRTEMKLCSVISDDERYRGGGGTALDASKYSKAPAAESPQISMLGMPATNISTTDFGNYARKRSDGWEANWFVARFVVEFLFEVIMGTENSQAAFNANKDANGLYQGGFGAGVTGLVTNWDNYNGSYPVIPTRVGLEAGDGVCLVEYKLPQTNGVDGDAYYTFQVPVFFGLVGAGFGNLWQTVRGLIVDVGSDKSLVYVANSIYAEYNPNTVDDKIMVEECTREYGYISRKSYRGLCCIATEVNGSSNTRYADQFQTNIKESARRIRFAGGSAYYGNHAGASQSYVYYVDTTVGKDITAPLCYFTEDPEIQRSQSIATNS